jgi:hypothetical protein
VTVVGSRVKKECVHCYKKILYVLLNTAVPKKATIRCPKATFKRC